MLPPSSLAAFLFVQAVICTSKGPGETSNAIPTRQEPANIRQTRSSPPSSPPVGNYFSSNYIGRPEKKTPYLLLPHLPSHTVDDIIDTTAYYWQAQAKAHQPVQDAQAAELEASHLRSRARHAHGGGSKN